jgi:hypothetical protein
MPQNAAGTRTEPADESLDTSNKYRDTEDNGNIPISVPNPSELPPMAINAASPRPMSGLFGTGEKFISYLQKILHKRDPC